MAHKKLMATAELFLNTKNAKKDAQVFIDDLKQKLTDIESAADKMTVFKDMVQYIAQIDKALAALKANNKDAFNSMFDGLDANLKKQFEGIFGIDGANLGKIDVLRDTLNNLTNKSHIKAFREFAKSLNEIYESAGLKAPFDLESEFKEISKEAKAKYIEKLSNQLANFATVWKDVNTQISKGFGIGGNSFGGISGLSQEVQDEIDKLKKQVEEINDIVDAVNNPKKVKVALVQQSENQVEQLKGLKNAFIDAENAKKQFETSKMTGTPEYLNSVAKYVQAAAELKSAFESTKLTKAGNEWIMSSGLGVLQDADNVLDKFFVQNQDLMDKVVKMYQSKIHDIGEQISFLENPYDTLKSKMEEYADLQKKMNRINNTPKGKEQFSQEEIDTIDVKIQELEKYLFALDKVGDKHDDINKILSGVMFGDMGGLVAAEEMCKLFGVDIPDAIQKTESALKSVGGSATTTDDGSVIGQNSGDIIEETKQTVDAIDYAKKELTKAWQEYYRAAQQAKNDHGLIIEDGEISPEMEKIKSSIDKKIDSWGATATNSSKWGVKVDLDLTDAIADRDIDASDIEREIDKLIKQHGISFNIPVEEVTVENDNQLDNISIDVQQSADTVVDTIELAKQKIVGAFKAYYRAVQEAKSYGFNADNLDTLPEIESMYDSIQDMFDKFGLLNKQKTVFNGKLQQINYDEIAFDDIENMVNNLVKFFETAGSPLQITANVSDIMSYDSFDNISKTGDVVTKEFNEATTAIDNTEDELVDTQTAFQNLVNYISQSGDKPAKFFDKLESGAQSVDDELKAILQSLNLIDSSGNINLSSIKSGFTNKGGFVSDQYTMIARRITGPYGQDYLGKSEKLQTQLESAKQAGAQIGAIFDLIKDEAHGLFYEIQNTVPGTAAFSHHKMDVNADVLNASKDQLSDLVHTMKALSDNGLFIDFGGDNILYDKDKGFSIIDLGLVGDQHHTVSSQNTLQENLDRFIKEYFKFAPSNMHADIQTMLADTLYDIAQGVDANIVNPNGPSQKTISSNYNQKVITATKAEEAAHEQNTDAIDAEKAALEALIQLKTKAQNMKWKDFAKDESLSVLKDTAGFTSISQLEKFWKQARYEKEIDFYEISKAEAEKIFNNKLSSGLAYKWYSAANFNAKDQLENEILGDDEIRNAALNFLYNLYKNSLPHQFKNKNVQTFDDFLNTEFTLYRGDQAPLIYGEESKLSFSWNEDKAKDFNSNVGTIKLKPKYTIGNAGSGFDTEVETFATHMKDSSWFKETNEAFEDFYSKQTKEMQNEINAGLVNLEKRRIQDLLDENISKLTHKAGKDTEFQNGILKQFQQGDVPTSFNVTGDGSIADKFAAAYNGLSEIDKKLVAYYANLEAIGNAFPKQFSELPKSVVGEDANLFNAVLNDPSGVQKHVAKLTGESKFGIFGQNAKGANLEANMHKLNAQAIEEEKKKQEQLNQEKQKSIQAYHDVTSKLASDMSWEKDVPDVWNQLSDILHHVQSVAGTTTDYGDVIKDGGYLDNITGEVLQVKSLIKTINDLTNNTGIDLSYVQDYLSEIYKNADLDGLDSSVNQVVDKLDKSDYQNVSDNLKRLVNSKQGGSDEFNMLAHVWHQLKHVDWTTQNGALDDDINNGKYYSSFNGEFQNVSDLYAFIDEIKDKWGTDLIEVKEYLNQVFAKYNAGLQEGYQLDEDLLLDLDDDDLLLDFDDALGDDSESFHKAHTKIINELLQAHGDKEEKLLQLEKYLTDMTSTDKDVIDQGYIQNSEYGNIDTLESVYALIEEIQNKYYTDLSDVNNCLDEVFATYNNNTDASVKESKFVTSKLLDSLNYKSTHQLNGVNEFTDLYDKVSDVSKALVINYDDGSYEAEYKYNTQYVTDILDLIKEIETNYGENLDYVKSYLQQVFKTTDLDNFYKQKPLEYWDVKDKLFDETLTASDKDLGSKLSALLSKLSDVNLSSKELIDDGKVEDLLNDSSYDIEEIYGLVEGIQKQHAINLDYVKDYLDQVYATYNKKVDYQQYVDEAGVAYHNALEEISSLLKNSEIGPEKEAQLNDLTDYLFDIQSTERQFIDGGQVIDSISGEPYAIEKVYNLVNDIQNQHSLHLDKVKQFLDKLYESYNDQILPEFLEPSVDDNLATNEYGETLAFQSKKYSVEDYENAYKSQSVTAQNAIKDMAAFYQKYTNLQGKMFANDPVNFLISPDNATPSEIAEVQQTLEAFKAKKQEIANLPIVKTEDDVEKLQELQAEAVNLQNKLSSVKLSKYNPQGYDEAFNLSYDDAVLLNDIVNGPDVYDLYKNLLTEYNTKLDKMYDVTDDDFNAMVAEDATNSLNEYLLKLGEELKLEKQITAEKEQQELYEQTKAAHKEHHKKKKAKKAEVVSDVPETVLDTGSGKVVGGDYALEATLQQTNSILGNILTSTQTEGTKGLAGAQSVQKEMQDASPEDPFKKNLYNKTNSFNKYRKDLEGVEYVAESLQTELDELGTKLHQIDNQGDLDEWTKKFNDLKDNIKAAQSVFEQENNGKINLYQKELTNSFNKLTLPQREKLFEEYSEDIILLNKQKQAVKDGHAVELSGIKQITAALQEKIDKQIEANKAAKDAEKTQKKNAKFGDTAMINATAKHNQLSQIAKSDQFANSKEIAKALEAYDQAYTKMQNRRDALNNKDNITTIDKEEFKAATTECNEYAKALDKLIKNSFKLHNEKANSDDYMLGSDFVDDTNGRKEALASFAKEMYGVSLSAEDFKKNFNEAVFAVDNGDGTFTKMTAKFTEARNEIVAIAGDTKKAQGAFGAFWDELKGKFKSIGAYLVASFSFHEVWSVIRQGIQYVREIDLALTELRKVTDTTDQQYKKFLQTMSQTASVTGSTVKDLTSSAADWARLGYSMKEAGELAATTAKLLNVSEFSSVDEATSALVSSLQAFTTKGQDVGQRAEEIVDILNNIGNKYPVATNELAEGLATSSAALVAANNSIEEQVALLAAGNATMQDVSTVAAGLKIVAARLRGTTTDIDDDADSAVTNVSKLQAKIKALTAEANGGEGINIINEDGSYKSTYEILSEISKIFDKMDDVSSAALLELIAGKNRSSVIAAVLQNGDILEKAYADAFDSSGSSQKELDDYLNSIQGRIDLFNNSVQTMWMNFIDSETIKSVVDLGTELIKLVDTIGLIPTALGAFAGFKILSGAAGMVNAFAKSMHGAVFASDLLTASGQMTTLALTKESIAASLASTSFAKYAIEQGFVVVAEGATLTMTEALGAVFVGLAAKIKLAAASLWTFLTTTPLGVFTAIAAGIAVVGTIIEANIMSHEEYIEQLDKETEALQAVQSELKNVQSELKTTKDRIEELEAFAKDRKLSFVEQEELDRLRDQNAELERQERILQEREKRTKQKQIEAARKAAETDPNLKDQSEITQISATSYAAASGAASQGTWTGGVKYAPGQQTTETSTQVSEVKAMGDSFDIALKNLEDAVIEYDAIQAELENAANLDDDAFLALEQKAEDAEDKVTRYNDELDELFQRWESKYGDIGYTENATTEDEKWFNNLIRQYEDRMDKQSQINGDIGNSKILDRVFGLKATDLAKEFEESFEAAVKAGGDPSQVIAKLLASEKYTPLLNDLQTKFGITADIITSYFTQVGESAVVPMEEAINAAKTYSALVEEVTSYNDILSQTSEIVADNTEVTEEYKEALIKLVGSEEEVNACFDENNKLVVKDAKALNKLVKVAKNNTAQNIKLAKSQAVLDYYELYKEMEALRNGQTKLTASTITAIKAKYQEMGVLQKTIARYALLEAGLNDVIKTYEEFAEAQTFDSETNYIATVEEMITALGEAFNTGKLGTETAQVAIRGLIPEDVYQDIEALDTVEEKMSAIYDYFKTGKLAQYFDIVFDEDGNIESAEMKLGNLRKFIEDGLHLDENGDGIKVFEGADWQHFELSESFLAGLKTNLDKGGDGLQYFADQMGITREVSLAFFKAIEDHDIEWLAGDYSTLIEQIIPPALESKIYDTVQALADLDIQLVNGTISVEDYSAEYAELNNDFASLGQEARDQISLYNDLTEQLEEQKQLMADATAMLNNPDASELDKGEALTNLTTATEKARELGIELKKLETPTEVTIQFALDHIDSEIAILEDNIFSKFRNHFEQDSNGVWKLKLGIEMSALTQEEVDALTKYEELWAERHEIEVNTDPEDAQTALELIEKSAQSALDVIKSIDGSTIIVNTSSAVRNVNDLTKALQDLAGVEIAEVEVVTPTVTSSSSGNNKSSKWTQKHLMMHADGTAHASGDWGLPTSEHNSLVGELGPELVVDPTTSRYYTVGDHGAEMVDLKRGSIIFNHKQTEGLLKNGHIASRGKAYAEGNAHVTLWPYGSSDTQWEGTGYDGPDDPTWDAAEALDDALSDAADSVNEFEETIDWIEIRMEEFDERIGMLSAQMENLTTAAEKNAKIDELIATNQQKYADALAGAAYYENYAQQYLEGMNSTLVEAAKNGAIAINEFTKEQDEATVKAIQNYRDYAQKSADLYQQAEEIITEIANLAKQAFDNIATEFENKLSFHDSEISQYEANNDLLETDKGFAAEGIYQAIIAENEAKQKLLEQERAALQAELDTGKIEKYSDAWYEAVNAIAEVDTEIINLEVEIENLQDSINELHWEHLDLLLSKFQAVSDEAQNLLDILGTTDAVDEFGDWTDEGITSLGLLAQQMEVAEKQAAKYTEEIAYLEANWENLGYTQEEYVEKLDELKSGQYDAINAYHDAKEAIVDLNKTRVDAIKDGIEKEIDAYEELIETKKKALDTEKDLHDFQKNVMDQQKDIAAIERQIAALSGDNSMSARAKRAQLEAELIEKQAELEETYYDRSISDQQDVLDKELEHFQDTKEAEIEGWEKYLENVEMVVADSLAMVQANTQLVYAMLTALGQQYGLDITEALTQPWLSGELAIQNYGAHLNMSLMELASLFGLTVDEFAAKLGLTTEMLVSNLDITVAQMAENLGLTNEQLAARLGLTVSDLNGMMNLTIQELAANMGITLPALAEKLGTTTAGLAGNLDMTMVQFAGKMGITVEELAGKFGLSAQGLADKLGMTYQDLMNPFGMSMSATIDALKALEEEYKSVLDDINAESQATVADVNNAMQQYQESQDTINKPDNQDNNKHDPQPQSTSVGSKINAGNAKIYSDSYGGGGGTQYYASDPNYVVLSEARGFVLVRHHSLKSGYTGWFRKSDLPKFASGTLGTKKDQLAILDELGEELQLVPGANGRLEYVKKGTSIIPADITSNLMSWGALDPQDMLDRNRPSIGASHVVHNEINVTMDIAEVVHIDTVTNDTIPDLTKAVRKEMDSYMTKVNNAIRSKVR